VANKNDIYWVRQEVLANTVSFYMKTWEMHAEKHAFDRTPATQDHFYYAVTDPDHLRRSLDPEIGHEACIFEKFFEPEQKRFFVPVIYEEVVAPLDYEKGGKKGRVMTGYFENGPLSKYIGEIFWSNPRLLGGKESE
jgi:phosphoketolase